MVISKNAARDGSLVQRVARSELNAAWQVVEVFVAVRTADIWVFFVFTLHVFYNHLYSITLAVFCDLNIILHVFSPYAPD